MLYLMATIKSLNQAQGVLDCRPAQGRPSPEPKYSTGFHVNVLFTSPEATRSAVNLAAKLAGNLDARIRIIAPHVVPYPLQLNQPTVAPKVTEQKARAIMGDCSLDAEIDVCLCREALDAALSILQANSVVLIGGRRRLWPTAETQLAGQLRRHGHQVLFVDQD
jgi:hypothetical protein